MKKTTIIPALMIGALLVAGSAFAWPGGHNKGFQGHGGQGMTQEQHADQMKNQLEKMAVILDLTEQQKGQIKVLSEKKWQDRQSMRTEMKTSREALRKYQQGNNFDESEFRAIAKKHADLKTEMMVQRAKTKQQIFAVLTPEQQQKAEKLRGMRGEGFFGRQNGEGFNSKHGGAGNCDGHGRYNGQGSGQRFNN